jgi:small membrane protein
MEYYAYIALIFFAFAWSRALLRFRDGKINANELVGWTILWVGLGIVVVLPQTIAILSKFIGIQRPIDVFVYGSIIVLFYLVFKAYVKIEGLERNLTTIVRKDAISNARKRKD